MEALSILRARALKSLADAVARGVLSPPFSDFQLRRFVSAEEVVAASELLRSLSQRGFAAVQLEAVLRLLEEVKDKEENAPRPQLVWSDLDPTGARDTAVVCKELFRGAERSVLLSTYNLGHWSSTGVPGNPVLRPLAERMAEVPTLKVRLFLNIKGEERSVADSLKSFADKFRRWTWPWERLPEVYYDPRALSGEASRLHAKCVVVDDKKALVTSANLTVAAQQNNIEAGVLLEDAIFAKQLREQFETLIQKGWVRRLKFAEEEGTP
jgi:hypothetical protein